jgi:anti-anti-sigma regulatory factor
MDGVSMRETQNPGISITTMQGMLLVTMQPDLDSDQFRDLNTLLGEKVARDRPKAVVLDFSTVQLLSHSEYERIYAMLLSLHLLGPKVAISNLSREVVLYLAESEVIHPEIRFFLSIEDAMQHFSTEGGRQHAR